MSIIKKILVDLASTLYDDQNFKFMSLPRILFAISSFCIVIAWLCDQFFGFKFANLSILTAWSGICAGAYGFKKFADNGKPQNNSNKGDV